MRHSKRCAISSSPVRLRTVPPRAVPALPWPAVGPTSCEPAVPRKFSATQRAAPGPVRYFDHARGRSAAGLETSLPATGKCLNDR